MSRFFRFSPSRLALVYIGLGVLALALFAVLLWYAWRANLATFREYVGGEQTQKFSETFDRQGAEGLSAAIAAGLKNLPRDEIIVFADPAKQRLAGNLNDWPPQIPEAPGTYGLVIALGGGSSMRVVASHVILPGGYHLLLGRESVRFESLVERFWYGITGAIVVVLLLGGLIGWLSHRALLNEVNEISRTASAISKGNLSRRVATRGGLDELNNLARTVNGMLEQVAAQNVQLESEIGVRRQAEHALHRAHEDLESLVAERTAQLARTNESLRRNEAYLAEAQRLSHTGTFGWIVSGGDVILSEETFRIFEYDRAIKPTIEVMLQRTHPNDRALVRQMIDRVSQDGTAFDFDHRLLMPNGSVKYVRVVGHPSVEDKSGNFEFVGAITDITERKRAEQRLRVQYTVTQLLAEATTIEEVTPKILQTVCEFLLWDLGALWSLDRQASVLRCVEVWHKESVKVPQFEAVRCEITFMPGIGLPGRVWSRHEPAYISNVVHDTNFPHASIAAREGLHAAFAFPILLGGDVLGVMEFFSHEIRQPEQELLNMMATLGSQIGQFIERKRAEDVNARLAAIVESSDDAIISKDLQGTIMSWNNGAARMFGYTAAEAVGQPITMLIPTRFVDEEPRILERIRRGETLEHYETVRRHKDGREINISLTVSPLRDDAGNVVGASKIARDITERKRVEQRLLTQHTVTRILAEAASLQEAAPRILRAICESLIWNVAALWTVDKEAGVLRCVEVWKESVEVPEFEAASRATTFGPGIGLPGRVWFSREPAYIPDVVHDANFPRAPIAAREGLHAAFGFPILLGGDVLGVIEFFSKEIRQPGQDLLNMMTAMGSQIGQFIERKHAEEAFRSAQMELAHVTRVATLGEMTGSIAHEVNQPLAAIVNNANACLNWLKGNNMEEARTSVELIRADGHRAGEIIGRIRALVKKAPPQKDWLDINQTIREVVALAHSEVERNRVALETELSDAVQPLVFADRIQLQQVILNLIMNAVEAMSEITDGRRQLLIRTDTDESERIAVAVQDSGPGVKPEDLHRLFTPFYTTKPQGMGMGLAICRSIVEAHGGRLWATANLDKGATFQFTLPIGDVGVS